MYHYLYYSPITQHREIYRRSPISDIFSIIITFIEVILFRYGKINILDLESHIGFNELVIKFNEVIETVKISELTKNNIMRLITIGNVINNFYQEKLKEFEKNIYKQYPESKRHKEAVNKFNSDVEMINFIFEKPKLYMDNPPIYNNDKDNSKLRNDYIHLDNIMEYLIKSRIFF
jgi:hypothetical protein